LVSPVVQYSIARGYAFLFASELFETNGLELREKWATKREAFYASFEVDENLWKDYMKYAVENGFKIGGESTPENPTFTQAEVDEQKAVLKVIIKARMAQRLYRSEAWYPVFNSIDPLLISAVQKWDDAAKLAKLSASPATN